MKISDFYGERIRSRYHGEGALTKVYGEEIYVKYDKGGSYVYRSNVFASGDLEFLNPESLEPFNAAYSEHIHSRDGRIEDFTTWLYRDY